MSLEEIARLQDSVSAIDYRQLVRLGCEAARELEAAGDYEAARRALSDVWQRAGEYPKLDDLDQFTSGEVLLRSGALTGWIGSTKQIDGAQEIAKNLISESAGIFEALQLPEKVAEARIDLAICYWREGAFDEARITLREALACITDTNGDLKARALLNSALVEKSAARFNEALFILSHDAAPLLEVSSNPALKGRFHGQLGNVLAKLHATENRQDYGDRALIEYAAASLYFEQAGNDRSQASIENNLGFLHLTAGRFVEAHQHLDRARKLFVRLKDSIHTAQVDETRARVLLGEKRNAEAEKMARAAVRLLEQGDEQSLLAEALATHGTALARTKRFEEAQAALQRAIEIAHLAGDPESAGASALTMSEELSEYFTPDERRVVYERADQLLASSREAETLARLRNCARRVLSAKPRGANESVFTSTISPPAPRFVYAAQETAALLRHAYRLASITAGAAVLVTGETGTGKEVLARMIHEWSGRAGEFVAVNCAALTDTLVESQLFGHQRGSFADAHKNHQGAARAASGGTLFLDEIGELSVVNQAKILRLVEYGEVHSLGASMPVRVNAQIIVSTRHDLRELVATGAFRSDLYYRLNTFHLEIPALRHRPDDIAPLVEHFLAEATTRHPGKRVRFAPDAIYALRRMPLPGNARELQSLVEATLLAATDKTIVTGEAIEVVARRQTAQGNFAEPWRNCSLEEEVRCYEGELIKSALKQSNGSVTRAARLLNITHQGLAFILAGRQKDLLEARTPIKRRRRSIIRTPPKKARA